MKIHYHFADRVFITGLFCHKLPCFFKKTNSLGTLSNSHFSVVVVPCRVFDWTEFLAKEECK
jgi:hypothetical protein